MVEVSGGVLHRRRLGGIEPPGDAVPELGEVRVAQQIDRGGSPGWFRARVSGDLPGVG